MRVFLGRNIVINPKGYRVATSTPHHAFAGEGKRKPNGKKGSWINKRKSEIWKIKDFYACNPAADLKRGFSEKVIGQSTERGQGGRPVGGKKNRKRDCKREIKGGTTQAALRDLPRRGFNW